MRIVTYEEEVLARHSTPSLRRNTLTRDAKKRNMEFDGQYHGMSKRDRDEFLDTHFGPEEKDNTDGNGTTPRNEPPKPEFGLHSSAPNPIRPLPQSGGAAEPVERSEIPPTAECIAPGGER